MQDAALCSTETLYSIRPLSFVCSDPSRSKPPLENWSPLVPPPD
jgi:hypothetical protein